MATIKCKECGGDLVLVVGQSVAECEFCGRRQTVPSADDEKKLIQFERAERLRKQCEFDKAAGIYETIVADFRQEAEAYWGLVLCKYGIEYVDDPATSKKIPTCHRSSFDSIMEDSDFEQVLENADVMARRVYREEAKQIEEIRKGIIAVSANEQPYDIFICYKETAENGERTLDSVLAQDVYDALTDRGYRVFFSRISLEDKLGTEYEPYIFAALNSAKIMLVFGTDYEYFNAVWVKNEWSRFLKLMSKDKEKHLIPCFKGIDAYDMPKEFARLQAQDLAKVGAMQDLLRGVEKILPRSEVTAAPVAPMVSGVDLDALLKRGWMALEDGTWNEAAKSFDQVLDRCPESLRARLGNYLAGKQIRDMAEAEREYASLFYDTRDHGAVKRIRNLADAELTAWFQKMDAEVQERERLKRERLKQEHLEQERLKLERLEREHLEQERLKWERLEWERLERERLEPIRMKLKKVQGFIRTGDNHTVGLRTDGTVVAVGNDYYGKCRVSDWTDIVAIGAGGNHTVGLKADGTVVAVGDNMHSVYNVDGWTDIVAICAGDNHIMGLKSDGTVVTVGNRKHSVCSADGWTNIVAICAGPYHTVGLRADGTVVAVGDSKHSRCNVNGWTDIVAINAATWHTVGLKADGTVVAVGDGNHGQCDVENWTEIVAISAGDHHTVGLRADGTVVAVGDNKYGRCNVDGWTEIVAISTSDNHTVGLKADGTVVAVGYNDYGQCNVSDWKLFQDYEKIDEERHVEQERKRMEEERQQRLEQERLTQKHMEEERQQNLERERQKRRLAGLCQHCGGPLKGLFSKKCTNCGKAKDY